MSKNRTPQIVKDKARWLIDKYGCNFEYIGQHEGKNVYMFIFPNDIETGFPFIYLWDRGDDIVELTGFEALDITNLLIKD